MNESKNSVEVEEDQSTGASKRSLGCLIAVVLGFILLIAAIITAVIVIALSLFSDENSFGEWDFGFIDDINQYLAEEFNDDSSDNSNLNSEEVAGLNILIHDYYYEDIGVPELSDSEDEVFVVYLTVTNIHRDYFTLGTSAFHIEIGDSKAYPHFDGTMSYNDAHEYTGTYNENIEKSQSESFYLVFEKPLYFDFDQDKTLVYEHYGDNEQAEFELPIKE